ncbi:hypothetical protein HWV62_22980 [Athelia sp. TMB]|nr:hypothetical protein HWV62_22980 [Athelia sp. TMB]
MDCLMMESIYGHGVEPCLDTPPLPLWMTEPTALHDLPFQPFYLALSASSPAASPSIASSSAASTASTSTSTPAVPPRTSVARSRPSPADDALSSAFWSLTHTPAPPPLALGRERWGALWDAREAQVTWDTQDPRRSLLWFEAPPGSGVWVSRERPRAKKNVTRSERRREEAEAAREKAGEGGKGREEGGSPRKRVRAAPQDAEAAGPSRRSARNRGGSPARLSPLGDTAEEDSQMLMLRPAASPASSLSSLPPDSTPCTPAPAPHSALNLLTTVLFASPASSSGSSTAVSPTASERALNVEEGGRARSGSTSTVVAVESAVAKGKRKHEEDEEEAEADLPADGGNKEEEGEVRRTSRPRARTSKAQSLEAAPRQRARRRRVRA